MRRLADDLRPSRVPRGELGVNRGAGCRGALGRWLPVAALLLALATLFAWGGDRDRFYRAGIHNVQSGKNLAMAENLTPWGVLFLQLKRRRDGTLRHVVYHRFPIGGYLLIKLATAPFGADPPTRILAGRMLLLTLFSAAALLAYLSVARLAGSRGIAVAATLLAFSSYYALRYSDMICTEATMDLFGVMLAFHGMVVFRQEGRFAQLVAKVCAALLLGWHVYGLLAVFLALGAGGELIAAWRAARAGAASRVAALVKTLARSRYARLGVIAVTFGAAVLGYGLAREYGLLEQRRPAVEALSTAQSALRRSGLIADANPYWDEILAWPNFLKWQFHFAGSATIPYAFRHDLGVTPWRRPEAAALTDMPHTGGAHANASLTWVGVGAVAACLVGLPFAGRGRVLLATLALFNFAWAVPMRRQAAEFEHDLERMFYLGLPLTLVTLALTGASRALSLAAARRAVTAAAGAAVLVFAVSSAWMAELGADATVAAAEDARVAEFAAIRELTRGKDVLVAVGEGGVGAAGAFAVSNDVFRYLMGGTVLRYAAELTPARYRVASPPDFVLAPWRYDIPSLRTPAHRFVFLYDSPAALEAVIAQHREDYRRIAATAPVAAGSAESWDVYAPGGAPALAYLRAPCPAAARKGRFYLRIAPAGAGVSGRAAAAEVPVSFSRHGVAFDDKCLMRVPLPGFPAGGVTTGQYAANGGPRLWQAKFRLDVDALRRARRAAGAASLVHAGLFNVYATDGLLTYVREPCAAADVAAAFFLHVVPVNAADLPRQRQALGFENLDFAFQERGAFVDGACVATVALPRYPVAQVRTGQFHAGAELWRAKAFLR